MGFFGGCRKQAKVGILAVCALQTSLDKEWIMISNKVGDLSTVLKCSGVSMITQQKTTAGV